MHTNTTKLRAWLGALALLATAGAQAQDPATAMEGKYALVSSISKPDSLWKFTKARLEVTRLDKSHVLIAMACEWADEPKAACDEWWTAQVRDGSVYLQDRNTDSTALRFDPSARTFTITHGAADGVGTVRNDVFKPDPTPTTDKALIRRMKRAHWSAKGTWNPRDTKEWTYTRANIVFGAK